MQQPLGESTDWLFVRDDLLNFFRSFKAKLWGK
jgi:hypothetical protein